VGHDRLSRAAPALLLGALVIAGCGGSSPHRVAGGLPAPAKVVFASDAPVNASQLEVSVGAGKIVASLPFVLTRDGFSFQNYGFIAGDELDQHALRELFGDQVCAGTPSDSCTLTPVAQEWAESVEAQMAGGHCYGFSMTALRFFEHNLSAQAFGAGSTYSLAYTPQLESELAVGWATQLLPPAQKATHLYTPAQMIKFLTGALEHPSQGLYTLTIWDAPYATRSDGHAITPIAIKSLGGGKYDLLIYDNNYPGITRAISVDTVANTWSYQVAPTPAAKSGTWSGSGSSNEMELTPVSTVTRRQPCPFCGGSVSGYDMVSLGGDPDVHGHLLITASGGRRLGYVNGKPVDQIPGSRIVFPQLNQIWKAAAEPIYELPAGDHFTVALQGATATATNAAAVYVSGPRFGARAANLLPSRYSSYVLSVAPGELGIRVQGTAPTTQPTLQLASSAHQLTASPLALASGSALNVRLNPAGEILVGLSGTSTGTQVALASRTVAASGSETVRKRAVGLGGGQQAAFSPALARVR
jgi:hypothetical protein